LVDKVVIKHNVFMFTGDLFVNDESEDKPRDHNVIRSFKLLGLNAGGRIYPLYFGDVQPDWTDESENSRYHIRNRFPQKQINEDYTLQGVDNGHTIFVNNGSGDVVISVDKNESGINTFRECRIIQLGTGSVAVL